MKSKKTVLVNEELFIRRYRGRGRPKSGAVPEKYESITGDKELSVDEHEWQVMICKKSPASFRKMKGVYTI
ncbi:hypothetical protein JTE90_014175 [Oedothorax gibbosus]|uniref:Transposase n=1 Tax=Oedothorax gibbosus TaxID=931172 RepID=A0AAV6VKC6_9ARAC|nr:hypothetical protein JTE90_014175 [Oedothorax gibbosus]